jgi:hypothetical protein
MRRTVTSTFAVLLSVFALAGAAAAVSQGSGVAARADAAEVTPTVLLATGRNFPDALSGAVLTHAYDAPLMLTEKTSLPATVAAEIKRLGATRVIILGSEKSVGPEVVAALAALPVPSIQRIGGSNRYATSAAIAIRASQALQEARDARLKEVRSVVASETADLRTQISALAVRVGLLEGNVADLDTRLGSVETSISAPEDPFWPEGLTLSTGFTGFPPGYSPEIRGNTWYLCSEMNEYPRLEVTAGYQGQQIHTFWVLPRGSDAWVHSIVIYHVDGRDYASYQGTGTPPTEGAPIEIEYWFEMYGQRVHETKTIPGGWTYKHP